MKKIDLSIHFSSRFALIACIAMLIALSHQSIAGRLISLSGLAHHHNDQQTAHRSDRHAANQASLNGHHHAKVGWHRHVKSKQVEAATHWLFPIAHEASKHIDEDTNGVSINLVMLPAQSYVSGFQITRRLQILSVPVFIALISQDRIERPPRA